MRKTSFALLLLCLNFLAFSIQIFAQDFPEVNFEGVRISVLEPKANEKKQSIKISATGGNPSQYPVTFKVKNTKQGSADTEDYEFDSGNEYKIDKEGDKTTIWITIKSDKKTESDETIIIEIESNTSIKIGKNKRFTVEIDEVPNSELVRLTTGVDFDFETNDAPLSFYGELNGFLPDLFKQRWGTSFRIFSNRFSSIDSMNSSTILNFRTGEQIVMDSDTTIPTRRIVLTPTENTVIRNYGLSLSPMYRLYSEGNSSLYASLLIEGMISVTSSQYSYDTVSVINRDMLVSDFQGLEENSRIKSSSQSRLYIGSIMFAVPFRYLDEEFEARIIPGIGYSKNHLISLADKRRLFYSLDINVLDRNFGITIGGNVRAAFRDSLPRINIYIAKSFNFVSFAKFD